MLSKSSFYHHQTTLFLPLRTPPFVVISRHSWISVPSSSMSQTTFYYELIHCYKTLATTSPQSPCFPKVTPHLFSPPTPLRFQSFALALPSNLWIIMPRAMSLHASYTSTKSARLHNNLNSKKNNNHSRFPYKD